MGTGGALDASSSPELRFRERMAGYISAKADPDTGYEEAAEVGLAEGTSIQFETTIVHPDVRVLLADPTSPARITGSVLAPALCRSPMEIVEGRFVLLVPQSAQVEQDRMEYRMVLRCPDEPARLLLLQGHKVIRVGSVLDAFKDTTTLFVTAYQGTEAQDTSLIARGIMHIGFADVIHLLDGAEVVGVDALQEKRYLARFGAMFLHSLLPFYGGVFDELGRFPRGARGGQDPGLPHSRPGEVYLCDPSGAWHESGAVPDACSRLVRRRGGDKGPVVLASGFAMSATSFERAAAHPNLVDTLMAAGYDVWLFDYRAGIDLPSAETQFTVDDVARVDWPRAVDQVLAVTGADSVQVFGHCVGSVSLLMGLLDEGHALSGKVRSAVCAQFTLHPETSKLKVFEADVHLGNLLAALDQRVLHPNTARTPLNVALDVVLRAVPLPPGEECRLPICRWINAVFGLTHRHAQLDDATHSALPEMFGPANTRCLEHLGLMMKRGKAVDAHGRDRYLPYPERMRGIPVLFLAGDDNYIFRPEGTVRTFEWLREHNDPDDYTLRRLPGYAHLDALVGRHAAEDVFPHVVAHLDRYA